MKAFEKDILKRVFKPLARVLKASLKALEKDLVKRVLKPRVLKASVKAKKTF